MDLCAEPLRRPAPLGFAIVWIAFTTGHAAFMLGGARQEGPGVTAALLAFYALFFAVGFQMLRSALGWRRFTRTFGTPSVHSATEAGPGDVLQLVLRFDGTWPPACRLSATAAWVVRDEEDDRVRTFAQMPLHVEVQRAGVGAMAHVTGMLPLPPLAARAEHACLELHLLTGDDTQRGWRIRLPDIPVFAVPAFPAA